MIEVKIFDKQDLKGYTFIEGFPGVGLVGPMAISYIIDKLGMSYIGYMQSSDFPPLISIHNYKPLPSVRVYASKKYKIVTIFAEFPIPVNITYDVAEAVYKVIKLNGIAKLVSIGGMPVQVPDNKTVFAVVSDDKCAKEVQQQGIKAVPEGVSAGVSGQLLLKAASDNIPAIDILVPVDKNMIDPIYAELAITYINKLAKLDIDVQELEKESKEVQTKVREILKKGKETHDSYKNTVEGTGPSMYA
jgi:uncharacterized protein